MLSCSPLQLLSHGSWQLLQTSRPADPAVSVLWLLLQFLVNTFPLNLQSPRSSDIGKVHFYHYPTEIVIRDYSALTETVLFLDFRTLNTQIDGQNPHDRHLRKNCLKSLLVFFVP